MYRMMYKDAYQYVADRDGIFYYVRRVPNDVRQHYASSRISFSLRTKSHQSALRAAKSVTQRLEDYWLGLRLQQMDIPAIHLVKTDDVEDASPLMMDAVEMYLSIKGKDDRTFIRTARRNGEYVSKVLGNRPITSYSSSEAAQFRDWCFEQSMNINTVKRVFASVRSIINLTMREHGIEGRNAFSGTFMPDRGDASTRRPIPADKLRTIQQRCQTTDDEPRWLVALISDTGMRLSEAAGLAKED
ncbi:MAG: integrase, partial [Gammaproteobacteria bacterium]|nr:integrase [Gammaproteobacteria bacterium]